jgi:hypothetical protein
MLSTSSLTFELPHVKTARTIASDAMARLLVSEDF